MFNKNNFCHVASNNRNEQKAGLFVYKTTDDLDTVLVSGYFNEKIIDINLHDVIIHVKTDPTDKTNVQQNVLCVTERTLDNVGTKVVLSQWEGEIETEIQTIEDSLDDFVKKNGTSIMTGPLKFKAGSFEGAIAGGLGDGISIYKLKSDGSIDSEVASLTKTNGFVPGTTNTMSIGSNALKWKDLHLNGKVYVPTINNGSDLAVPNPGHADTIALKSQVDLAANSGRMITDQGLWYAKMDSATVAPAAENGTNYADFSQTDGQGNPIIVIYTRVNGAWAQDQTITPPADYDGYVPITSKIWDIPEQAGQQGGRILWNHQSKEFTPYPQIVSFENINVTGDSNVMMPQNPGTNQIVNKDYVDNAILQNRSVKFATYGITTYQEIADWVNAGAMVFVKHNGLILSMSVFNASICSFTASGLVYDLGGNPIEISSRRVAVTPADVWSDDLGNTYFGHEIVSVQLPTSQNNYTWYRKYADGWVEQGGRDDTGTGTKTINLPITMQDEYYTVTTATMSNTATHGATVQNTTTTTVQLVKSNTVAYWQVSGMAQA